jgi:ankyrin repeat protein
MNLLACQETNRRTQSDQLKFLIASSADVNKRNQYGETPLVVLIKSFHCWSDESINGNLALIEALLQKDALLHIADNDGFSAFDYQKKYVESLGNSNAVSGAKKIALVLIAKLIAKRMNEGTHVRKALESDWCLV